MVYILFEKWSHQGIPHFMFFKKNKYASKSFSLNSKLIPRILNVKCLINIIPHF